MSQSIRKYLPNYQIGRYEDVGGSGKIYFEYSNGIYFTTKAPLFGATETQKAALMWAVRNRTPPVICVSHEAPITPDRNPFADPYEFHRTYSPYAMAIATVECLGEESTRKIKIYFCDVYLYEHNVGNQSKDTFVIEMDTTGEKEPSLLWNKSVVGSLPVRLPPLKQ